MGRIVDLCGEIAAAAEEGPTGLVLPPDAWDRLRADWTDDDIEDELGLVNDIRPAVSAAGLRFPDPASLRMELPPDIDWRT